MAVVWMSTQPPVEPFPIAEGQQKRTNKKQVHQDRIGLKEGPDLNETQRIAKQLASLGMPTGRVESPIFARIRSLGAWPKDSIEAILMRLDRIDQLLDGLPIDAKEVDVVSRVTTSIATATKIDHILKKEKTL